MLRDLINQNEYALAMKEIKPTDVIRMKHYVLKHINSRRWYNYVA